MIKAWLSGFKKIFFLLLFCLPASFFLIKPGFYEPQDLHHIADIYQMVRAIESGQIPPRLGPDYMFGYGYPLFNFYYPLPFYLGSLFFFLLGSLTVSFESVFILTIIISVIGMYLFLREFVDVWGALIGSFLFLYTPYRAVQIYVRGAMGEALALSLLPLFAWSIVRILKKPSTKRIILVGVIGAVFILSHNYFWGLSLPFLAGLIFIVRCKNKVISVGKLALGGFISLALSAYWWIPALVEQKLVSATTPFPLIDHFPFIKQLIIPFWGYGASLWGPGDGMSFQIGVVNLLISLILIISLIFRKKDLINKGLFYLSLWVFAGFTVSVFLMNIRSLFIWKLIPFYNFIQFPWRLLCFTTFFTAIAVGIITSILKGKKKFLFLLSVSFLSLLLTINYFKPSRMFYKEDNDYLNRFFANRTKEGEKDGVSKEYLLYSEDYLQLPYWVEKRPNDISVVKISSDDAKVYDVFEENSVSWRANVLSTGSATVVFHEMYFPGWEAEIDGKKTPIFPRGENGEIILNVNKEGVHEVKFIWQETLLRKIADGISIGAIMVIIMMFIFIRKNEE